MGLPLVDTEQFNNPEVLLDTLIVLREEVIKEAEEAVERWRPVIAPDRRFFNSSVQNLAAYLALRRRDLRVIQDALRPWGLSSLGRIEAQVMENLAAVIRTLAALSDRHEASLPARPSQDDFNQGRRILRGEADAIFGPPPKNRNVRTMVTLPTEAAFNKQLVREMVERGMNVARINCAHDTPDEWMRMIDNVRAAEAATERNVRIAMDLGGPKLRTSDVLQPDKHRVRRGDHVLLIRNEPADIAYYPAQVRCSLPEALEQVGIGHNVWFDDGKIGTKVIDIRPEGVVLEVTRARDEGERLRVEKGINFPDSMLHLDALTEKDLLDLDFVIEHADIINFSFVQTPADVRHLQTEIDRRRADKIPALVLKIETSSAIKYLPELIVTAGSRPPGGGMIARGDLAVEIGYERLAEMQEQIMWVCEAAHTPVIWATQVLEGLAKKGRPSRAEVTDAAMAERAECVMLNKGPYILDAISILDGILGRMAEHQSKKSARLRALRSW